MLKLYFYLKVRYNNLGDDMSKRNIDLSYLSNDEYDLDKTSSFTDIMSRSERKKREYEKQHEDNDDIEKMVNEKKRNIEDIENTKDIEKKEFDKASIEIDKKLNKKEKATIKEEDVKDNKKSQIQSNEITEDDKLAKTQILELTRQMKFNFEETKKENNENKKKGISILNIIGEVNLLCIAYYIYLLIFTNYQNNKQNYMISGGIVILLVMLFGISVITGKKASKVFNILNILVIIAFIAFHAYTLIEF